MQKIKIEQNRLMYRNLIGWKEIKISEIRQIYLRIEEARTTIGCCPAFFETPYLMIRTDQKTFQILCETKEQVKSYLGEIQKLNPQIEVGFKKQQ